MAEAEEIVTDVARHATVFARDLWRRHRKTGAATIGLADVAPRIDLLITTVFGRSYPIRIAEPPAPPTLLTAVFGHRRGPVARQPIPATDGSSLWLPANLGIKDRMLGAQRYRVMALQQAMRANRGSAYAASLELPQLVADFVLLIEACAADAALQELLPGMAAPINESRRAALGARPPLYVFPKHVRPFEMLLRRLLRRDCAELPEPPFRSKSTAESVRIATRIVADLVPQGTSSRIRRTDRLFRDRWTGEFRAPTGESDQSMIDHGSVDNSAAPRSARLSRRPDVRKAIENEDQQEKRDSPWMIQADEPHQKAEDPMGLQRPADRDDLADEVGDMLSELRQARLVTTPGQPREVLLSDDPPESRTQQKEAKAPRGEDDINYPEWDYRIEAYREPGARVRTIASPAGPQAWVDNTMYQHRSMLELIRRRFEMLRARRIVLRKQLDGEEVDFDACIDAMADLYAGAQMPEGLYRTCRRMGRDMAIMLLIDVSGSTDGWVAANRRIIDIEREALLLVCIALGEIGEPYAVQAFSGEGPQAVTVKEIKHFDEPFGNDIALRIAALEPERYTRAGAAIRHATAHLMRRSASHRLLLLLSDGKPNDVDVYQGRYGVLDLQRAVAEARLQGISPFCLTIDRQAADYLPNVFGPNQYAMLPRPEMLPTVLLDWLRRLLNA